MVSKPRAEKSGRDDEDENGVERRRWHFKREISSGDLILAVAMVIGLISWGSGIDKRLTSVEERQAMQQRVDAAQDTVVRDAMTRIEGTLRDIQQFLLQDRGRRSN